MPEGRIAWFWLFAAGKRTNSRHDFWYGKNNKIVVLCIYIFDGGGESPFRIMKKNFIFLVCAFLCLGTFLGSCKDGGDSDIGNSGFPEHFAEYLGDKNYKSPKNVEISEVAAENQFAGLNDNWWYDEMEYNSEEQSFSVSVELKAGIYQFKFDKYCDWNLSYGSGEENKNGKAVSLGEMVLTSTEKGEATNFAVTISTPGKYLFTFYEADKLFSVADSPNS